MSSPPSHTVLRLTGRDALAVLHRIGTQKLDDLGEGEARVTLFCDFRGRLLHGALVVHRGAAGLDLLRDDAPAAPLAAFLDRNIFREDVHVEDRSADVAPLAPHESEATRILAGHAAHGHEITEEFTPYEVNLAEHVHLDKGCFTGQEALQRLITYDSVRRQLVQVAGDGAPPEVPGDVLVAGAKSGRVTSAAAHGAGWVALAVLRRDAVEQGAAFTLADGRAITVAHVFETHRPLGRL